MNGRSATPSSTANSISSAPRPLSFPKARRLLRPSEFRQVYDHGARLSGPCFAAFYWRNPESPDGPRLGFTAPRALGKATKRNRMKRRVREALRLRLPEVGTAWWIVINLRRGAYDAPVEIIRQEVSRLVQRCAA